MADILDKEINIKTTVDQSGAEKGVEESIKKGQKKADKNPIKIPTDIDVKDLERTFKTLASHIREVRDLMGNASKEVKSSFGNIKFESFQKSIANIEGILTRLNELIIEVGKDGEKTLAFRGIPILQGKLTTLNNGIASVNTSLENMAESLKAIQDLSAVNANRSIDTIKRDAETAGKSVKNLQKELQAVVSLPKFQRRDIAKQDLQSYFGEGGIGAKTIADIKSYNAKLTDKTPDIKNVREVIDAIIRIYAEGEGEINKYKVKIGEESVELKSLLEDIFSYKNIKTDRIPDALRKIIEPMDKLVDANAKLKVFEETVGAGINVSLDTASLEKLSTAITELMSAVKIEEGSTIGFKQEDIDKITEAFKELKETLENIHNTLKAFDFKGLKEAEASMEKVAEFEQANEGVASSAKKTGDATEEAEQGITGEGNAAKKAAEQKEEFAKANEKVADSAAETRQGVETATEAIKKMEDATDGIIHHNGLSAFLDPEVNHAEWEWVESTARNYIDDLKEIASIKRNVVSDRETYDVTGSNGNKITLAKNSEGEWVKSSQFIVDNVEQLKQKAKETSDVIKRIPKEFADAEKRFNDMRQQADQRQQNLYKSQFEELRKFNEERQRMEQSQQDLYKAQFDEMAVRRVDQQIKEDEDREKEYLRLRNQYINEGIQQEKEFRKEVEATAKAREAELKATQKAEQAADKKRIKSNDKIYSEYQKSQTATSATEEQKLNELLEQRKTKIQELFAVQKEIKELNEKQNKTEADTKYLAALDERKNKLREEFNILQENVKAVDAYGKRFGDLTAIRNQAVQDDETETYRKQEELLNEIYELKIRNSKIKVGELEKINNSERIKQLEEELNVLLEKRTQKYRENAEEAKKIADIEEDLKNNLSSSIDKEMGTADEQMKAMQASGKYTKEYQETLEKLRNDIKEINEMRLRPDIDVSEVEKKWEKTKKSIADAIGEKSFAKHKAAAETTLAKLGNNIESFMSQNTAMGRKFKSEFDNIKVRLDTAESVEDVQELVAEMNRLEGAVKKAGKTGDSFFVSLSKMLKSRTAQMTAMYLSFYDIIRYARQAFNTIKELDTALVDLKKTTTMNNSELEEFYQNSSNIAKQTGVTTQEIISQAAAWSRLNKLGLLYGNI